MKPRTRSAHVWVTVQDNRWKLTLDASGTVRVRQKGKHGAGFAFSADDLVRKARQLSEGSLCL
jgi:hypothetical protein